MDHPPCRKARAKTALISHAICWGSEQIHSPGASDGRSTKQATLLFLRSLRTEAWVSLARAAQLGDAIFDGFLMHLFFPSLYHSQSRKWGEGGDKYRASFSLYPSGSLKGLASLWHLNIWEGNMGIAFPTRSLASCIALISLLLYKTFQPFDLPFFLTYAHSAMIEVYNYPSFCWLTPRNPVSFSAIVSLFHQLLSITDAGCGISRQLQPTSAALQMNKLCKTN